LISIARRYVAGPELEGVAIVVRSSSISWSGWSVTLAQVANTSRYPWRPGTLHFSWSARRRRIVVPAAAVGLEDGATGGKPEVEVVGASVPGEGQLAHEVGAASAPVAIEVGAQRGQRREPSSTGVLAGDLEALVVEHVRERDERRFHAGHPDASHSPDHQSAWVAGGTAERTRRPHCEARHGRDRRCCGH
jgi:hypothetical protein